MTISENIKKQLLILLLPICCCLQVVAQNQKFFTGDTGFVLLDTGYIIPSTLQLKCGDSVLLLNRDYQLLPPWHGIRVSSRFQGQKMEAAFVCVPANMLLSKQKRSMISEFSGLPVGTFNPAIAPASTDEGNLVTDGVLLRGISFGNAQDLVLNSSLNLRMSGELSKGLYLEAALTDQEYPFQAEGTTSTLQDFDRIYVKAWSGKWSVLLGDHAFQGPAAARFSKFAKKNRGLQIQFNDTNKGWKTGVLTDLALARGRFARNEIQATEGLQGPYRLSGARNEQFIVVISGTEVVYVDGKKLTRGYQADYTIDYNLGEITFTPKVLVGQNSRIIVEFQYTDRFYSRAVASTSAYAENGKLHFFASAYTESDLKSQPIQQDLTLFDSSRGLDARRIMALAGDNPALAVLPSARIQQFFSPNSPNYILEDSAGVIYYRYVSSPDTGKIYYSVSFNFVGNGKGRYILSGSAANGKVYRFVGETAGVRQGDYEPITQLQTPNRLNLSEAGMVYRINRNNSLKVSGALSSQDKNLFSELDDANNKGKAISLEWRQSSILRKMKDSTRNWHMSNKLETEWTSRSFNTIERFRDVEFGRQWDRQLNNPENGSAVAGSRYLVHQTEISSRYLKLGGRLGFNDFSKNTGRNALLFGVAEKKGWYFKPKWELSRTYFDLSRKSNLYLATEAEAGLNARKWRWGVSYREESSRFSDNFQQGLLKESYGHKTGQFKLEKTSGKLLTAFAASRRLNLMPKFIALSSASVFDMLGGDVSLSLKKGGFVKAGVNMRFSRLIDSVFVTQFRNENHFTGRFELSAPALLKSLSGNIFYQSISAREQQRQFAYFEVPAGQGFFTWVDFNGNGVQEIFEFVDAPFKDQAKFVRLLVPTGQYINAQLNELNGNMLWRPGKSVRKWFSNRLSWNLNSRNTYNSIWQKFLPFLQNLQDAELISSVGIFRNQAEADLIRGRWMVQLTSLWRSNKIFFSNGPELRFQRSHTLFQRFEAGELWQIRFTGENRNSRLVTAFLPSNNFDYGQWMFEPQIVYQPGVSTRLLLGLKQSLGDSVSGKRLSSITEIQAGLSRSAGKTGMLDIRASMLNCSWFSALNTPMAFDLLQGFAPGRNYRLNADLRLSASGNIQILFNYEYRRTGESRSVHIGRAEARYLF